MAPNVYLAAKKALSPHTWFRRSVASEKFPTQFHASQPIPGLYSIHPLYGLVLIAKDSDGGVLLPHPIRIKKSEVTKRYYLMPDWLDRIACEVIKDPDGIEAMRLMFRLDDGISWVACEDEFGNRIKGPWPRYCIDQSTRRFRLMRRGDSPEYRSRTSLDDAERKLKAVESNKEPAPVIGVVDSSVVTPTLENTSLPDAPEKTTGTVTEDEISLSPDTLELPTPVTPGSATFMPPRPTLQGDGFAAKELDERLEKLRIEKCG